ncbi:MAG: kinetoplast-associated protein [Candidatus Gottesmanbacteria bacterium GW2011_GWA2_43_14]|uniref:Kinetoplast-associated protein n=2 Tax=Patescibacteria group TaxID=1783273 RepID=A0A0G1G8U7_9BACT|nr:MAG: kinetoplast-associated protein [Candidatus Gottesmanbacteria bacterium GW2011_GWA2_43_14]
MVYIFIILVVIAFGISLMVGKRRGSMGPIFSGISSPVFGVNVPFIFVKILALLLYVTFSYILIVALIQTSDISMKFFIEFVGGKDLFNIIFSGAGNTEANYITFVGYRDINPLNLEMVNTSLLFVRLTSLTYNVMSSLLIMRTVILWFLLIIAPFLALLMPFVFIRNIGWIWIGVFFQWLFYGPLFALFLASLTKIWVQGIPYSFDFSRVNKPSGQVYRTAINILWGGPAQTLSPGNSANYVDTYAEYFIALVMLWACIVLPWLLLRIFRDYCCAGISAAGNTLGAIFDRLRQYPPPPSSAPGPVTTSGMAQQLPFRQNIEEKVREVQVSRIEEIRDVSQVSTNDIVRAMDLSVSKLSDISRLETNDLTRTQVISNLDKVRSPDRIATPQVREKFMHLREELVERATRGDTTAQTILQASEKQTESLISRFSQTGQVTSRMAATPQAAVVQGQVPAITERSVIEKVSEKAGVAEIKTREVLSRISTEEINRTEKVETVARAAGVSTEKVREILHSADQVWKTQYSEHDSTVREVAQQTKMTESATRQILSSLTQEDLHNEVKVSQVAAKTGVSVEQVREAVNKSKNISDVRQITSREIVSQVSSEVGLSEEKTREILSQISLSQVSDRQKVSEVATKLGVSEEKVRETVSQSRQAIEVKQVTSKDVVSQVSSEVGLSEEKTREILSQISLSQVSDRQKVREVATKLEVSEDKVRETVSQSRHAVDVKQLSANQTISQVSSEVGLSEEKTREILSQLTVADISNTKTVQQVASKLEVSEDKVRETVSRARHDVDVRQQTSNEIVSEVSSEVGLSEEKTKDILSQVSQTQVSDRQKIKEVAEKLEVSEDKVKETVAQARHDVDVRQQTSNEIVSEVSSEVGLSEEKTKDILSQVSQTQVSDRQKIKEVAEKLEVSEDKVRETLAKAGSASLKSIAAKEQKVQAEASIPAATISLDDYQNVVEMWKNHYQNAPVPVTEKIRERADWLVSEEKKLTNVYNLLSSVNPEMKQQGLEKVSEILPFMLLGGFSEAEMLTYLKAKVEANRQVMGQLKMEAKLTEKIKEELKSEEEETLVEVTGKKEEEEKTAVLSQSKTIDEKDQSKEADEKNKDKNAPLKISGENKDDTVNEVEPVKSDSN